MASNIHLVPEDTKDKEYMQLVNEYYKTKDKADFLRAQMRYTMMRITMIRELQDSDDQELKDYVGMGFAIFTDDYGYDSNYTKFAVICMLDEIFGEREEFNLEKYLHENTTKDKILRNGIRKSIIDFVESHDFNLCRYLQVHPEQMSDIENQYKTIIDTWDDYYQRYRLNVDAFREVIDEFVNYYEGCNFTFYDLALYLKYQMGIDYLHEFGFDIDEEEDKSYFDITFKTFNLEETNLLVAFRKRIENYIKNGVIPDSYLEEETQKKELYGIRKVSRSNIKNEGK